MLRKPIAFLTMDCLDDFIAYDHFVKPPLAELGWSVVDVPWRNPEVQWNDFEAVIVRTPWDYHQSLTEFLEVIDRIDRFTFPMTTSHPNVLPRPSITP